MASACVKNAGASPAGYSSYRWSSSPRMSLSREDRRSSSLDKEQQSSESDTNPANQDPVVDFEFCLDDPVTMLSADELFSDGKLVPLKFSGPKTKPQTSTVNTATAESTGSQEVLKSCRRLEMEISELFSPKAPRCTTRWRELLGLKRLANTKAHDSVKTASSSPNPKTSSFKQFLHRGSKSSAPSLSADASPLLKDSDISESTSIASSRLSLSSSSSSGHEIDDLPRLSLDIDKPSPNPFAPSRNHSRNTIQPRIRLAKPRRPSNPSVDGSSTSADMIAGECRGLTVTADSPRLNASGKIVFHGLERSSSSPGSFTGGPRMKQHHGMPRSYSANVRVTPVLNVPVSSLKSGLFFGQLFSSSSASSSSLSSPSPGNKSQLQSNGKNRTNRTRLEPKCEPELSQQGISAMIF